MSTFNKLMKCGMGVFVLMTPYFVLAAEELVPATAVRVAVETPYESSVFDGTLYESLQLSFLYDATQLDATTNQDSFVYGYKVAGVEYPLGNFLGLAGSSTAEYGVVDVALPIEALASDLSVYVKVLANSSASSDKVEVQDLKLVGTLRPVVIDVCPNQDGTQAEIPAGYMLEAGLCVPIPPVVVDICPNIDAIQEVMPVGLIKSEAGECVAAPGVPTPTPTPKPSPLCPKGFARHIDKFKESHIWRADDVYRAVILVGGPEKSRHNRDRARFLYIAGPTEVGDKYYRRFHKISYICVKG